MEGARQMSGIHVYRCASCDHRFESEDFASRCPKCRSKVLLHESGPARTAKKGCRGRSCGGCGGCGGH